MNRAGVTLLETMVALVILGLVVTASFELYGSAVRSGRGAEAWTTATALAEEGMELAKLDLAEMLRRSPETLDDGFGRTTSAAAAGPGLAEVKVTVSFPDGATFEVRRLVAVP